MVQIVSKAQEGSWKRNYNIKKKVTGVSSHTCNILKEEFREHNGHIKGRKNKCNFVVRFWRSLMNFVTTMRKFKLLKCLRHRCEILDQFISKNLSKIQTRAYSSF